MTNRWEVTYLSRPWTANSERRWHHMQRAKKVAEWREAFHWLAVAERIPKLHKVEIVAQPLSSTRRWRADVAACYPAVKAAIDGLVDAGVIPDDNPEHLLSLMFLPVSIGKADGLRVGVYER